jgi:hypothetical protein
MRSKMEILEKKLRMKKMDAHKDELAINQLKLMEKIDKLNEEILLAESSITELSNEIKELEAQGE